jgi:cellobiose epimerase
MRDNPAQNGREMEVAADWVERLRAELVGNILPFWIEHAIDRTNGGFHGTIASDLTVHRESERSSVVNTRILWTYSAASRLLDAAYWDTAEWAFDAVTGSFWDHELGGLYWMTDCRGRSVSTRKQTYGQAFGIYAFAEYYRATGSGAALDLAKRLFRLLEEHCYDPVFMGYIEARDRGWQKLDDLRLSDRDLNCPKSMNTHLHVLEAYANLMRVWRDPLLVERQGELIRTMMDRIVDASTGHQKMFFDERWNSLSDHVSFGHDIETSWLLVEAAEVLGDAALIARAKKLALLLTETALKEGLDTDGSMFFEADGSGTILDPTKHWWVQAEAVVGFYNAYQIGGDERFLTASRRVWDYIEKKVVDRKHGEWHARLSRDGVPLTEADDPEAHLVGPWKCPYHNARVCFEMLERLTHTEETRHEIRPL